ncbi:MAG: hypothetical protein WCH04_10180 [Gammaproteobacteria bacterium]
MSRQSTVIALLALATAAYGDSQNAQTGPQAGESAPFQSGAFAAHDAAYNPQSGRREATGGMPAGAIRVQRADIIDPNGFEKPMVASTVLIPAGWTTQGGIVWGGEASQCGGSGYNVDFQATSPDGVSAIHFFPMEQWQWNSTGSTTMPGCRSQQVSSVQQYIENLVQRARPGARMLDYRRRPDIEKELGQQERTTPMPLGDTRTWVEAGEALIGYSQDGIEMRETVASAVMFTHMRMQSLAGMPGSEYLSASTFPGFAMRAPDGQLDFKLAEMIRKSARPNAQWTARVTQHNATIAGIRIKGARDRSRIISQTGEEIREMQADSWRRYNESSDRMSRETSEAIRGVETYNDPYNGDTVQLDNTYEHAWQLNDGSYVLTDDPDFKPYSVFGQDGRQLEATQ